jgi:hypothetical protein
VAENRNKSPSSPDAIGQSNLASTESEQKRSVSRLRHARLGFADDDQQSQRSGVNLFANAQNVVISDSKFVSLSHLACGYDLAIIGHRLSARTILSMALPILAKCRRSLYLKNPIPVPSLLDGKKYSTNLERFLLIVLH